MNASNTTGWSWASKHIARSSQPGVVILEAWYVGAYWISRCSIMVMIRASAVSFTLSISSRWFGSRYGRFTGRAPGVLGILCGRFRTLTEFCKLRKLDIVLAMLDADGPKTWVSRVLVLVSEVSTSRHEVGGSFRRCPQQDSNVSSYGVKKISDSNTFANMAARKPRHPSGRAATDASLKYYLELSSDFEKLTPRPRPHCPAVLT
jgi:hypothetical protein